MTPPNHLNSATDVDTVIDLNADLGETPGDLALMRLVTSANIACGGHAGDASTMRAALAAAIPHGVSVGAHPSYPDRAGFGRVELGMPFGEVAAHVVSQVTALAGIAGDLGLLVSYVKLHGALYHRAGRDRACADSIIEGLMSVGVGPLAVLAQPASAAA